MSAEPSTQPETVTPAESTYVALRKRFDGLSPGQRADIRRARSADDLAAIRAFYLLLPLSGEKDLSQWRRVIYFLPHARHTDRKVSLGRALAEKGVSEARLFQLVRSEPPADLDHLRRLLTYVDTAVDWNSFGKALFFWGPRQKQRLAEDFFLAQRKK